MRLTDVSQPGYRLEPVPPEAGIMDGLRGYREEFERPAGGTPRRG